MKGKFAIVLVLAAILALSGFTSALIRPDVRIIDYGITPALTPGGTSQLAIQLENVGRDDCAYRVNVQVAPLSPIGVKGPDTRFLGSICQKDGAKNVTFTLLADQSATLSNNPVTVSAAYESEYAAPYATSQTANVRIQGAAQLRAQVTGSNPLDVHPGDTAAITVTLDNVGSAKAQAISATLAAPAALTVKANAATQVVNELAAKKSTGLSYSVFVPEAAAAKDYALTLKVRYVDEYGQKQSADLPVTLSVRAKALFEAQTHDGRLFVGSNNVNVQFAIKNTGSAPAKKLRVKLVPQFPFSTDGSQRYVETLAPGATETADFTVSVDKEAALGHYALQLQASFEDEQGQSLSDTIDVTLTVPPKDLFIAVFVDFWFVWAILAIVAFFMRDRIRGILAARGKNKEKAK